MMNRLSNKEGYQRMNMLHQVAVAQTLQGNVNLGRYYNNVMKSVGKRLVIRVDPSIKRTICKRCEASLIPGVTSQTRLKAKGGKHMNLTCQKCGWTRRFDARKDHKLFSEKTQVTELVDSISQGQGAAGERDGEGEKAEDPQDEGGDRKGGKWKGKGKGKGKEPWNGQKTKEPPAASSSPSSSGQASNKGPGKQGTQVTAQGGKPEGAQA